MRITFSIPTERGHDVAALLTHLTEQKNLRRDFLVPQGRVDFSYDFGDAEALTIPRLVFGFNGETVEVVPTDTALDQLAQKLGIPIRYFQRCYDADASNEGLGLLGPQVNHWLHSEPDKVRLVRAVELENGTLAMRALLSDRYKILDNVDVVATALQAAMQAKEQYEFAYNPDCYSWVVGERRTDVLVAQSSLYADIKTGEVSALAGEEIPAPLMHGSPRDHLPLVEQGGSDYAVPVVRIRNSETGQGGLSITTMLLRRHGNTLVSTGKEWSRVHLGAQLTETDVLTEETRNAENDVAFMKVRDSVRAAFDPTVFGDIVKAMAKLTEHVIPDVKEAVTQIVERSEVLTRSVVDDILTAYSRDVSPNVDTLYDVVNAMSATAQTRYAGDGQTDAIQHDELEKATTKIIKAHATA